MASLLSTADLACIQANAALVQPDTCTIQRKAVASDGAGGQTATWSTLASCSCRVAPAGSDKEALFADRVSPGNLYKVALPAGQDVTEADRIIYSGRTLEVLGVQAPRSFEVERIVYAKDLA